MSINEPTSADAKRGKWVKYCLCDTFTDYITILLKFAFKCFCLKKLFDQLDQNTPRINQLNL